MKHSRIILAGCLILGLGVAIASAQTVFRKYTSLAGTELISDQINPTGASFTTALMGESAFKVSSTTVAALPTCNAAATGLVYLVTDATTPTYLATISNGGSAVIPVVCNGTNWQAH